MIAWWIHWIPFGHGTQLGLGLVLSLAPETRVQELVEKGQIAGSEERWADAAVLFAEAYNMDASLSHAWLLAQAYRFSSRCDDALPLYRRIVGETDNDEYRAYSKANIEECEQRVATGSDGDTRDDRSLEPPPPKLETSEYARAPSSSPASTRSVLEDPWGAALTWPGAMIAVAGSVTIGVAHAQGRAPASTEDEASYRDRFARATRTNTAGLVTLGVGSALVVAGVVRYAIVAARRRKTEDRGVARSSRAH